MAQSVRVPVTLRTMLLPVGPRSLQPPHFRPAALPKVLTRRRRLTQDSKRREVVRVAILPNSLNTKLSKKPRKLRIKGTHSVSRMMSEGSESWGSFSAVSDESLDRPNPVLKASARRLKKIVREVYGSKAAPRPPHSVATEPQALVKRHFRHYSLPSGGRA